jgi:hypothetical protein
MLSNPRLIGTKLGGNITIRCDFRMKLDICYPLHFLAYAREAP